MRKTKLLLLCIMSVTGYGFMFYWLMRGGATELDLYVFTLLFCACVYSCLHNEIVELLCTATVLACWILRVSGVVNIVTNVVVAIALGIYIWSSYRSIQTLRKERDVEE